MQNFFKATKIDRLELNGATGPAVRAYIHFKLGSITLSRSRLHRVKEHHTATPHPTRDREASVDECGVRREQDVGLQLVFEEHGVARTDVVVDLQGLVTTLVLGNDVTHSVLCEERKGERIVGRKLKHA